MELINLTPHDVNVYTSRGIHCLPLSGIVARTAIGRTFVAEYPTPYGAVPIYDLALGEVNNLPEPDAGVLYVVSSIVGQSLGGRGDLLVPDSLIRENGRVVGCRSFSKL